MTDDRKKAERRVGWARMWARAKQIVAAGDYAPLTHDGARNLIFARPDDPALAAPATTARQETWSSFSAVEKKASSIMSGKPGSRRKASVMSSRKAARMMQPARQMEAIVAGSGSHPYSSEAARISLNPWA